MNLGAPELLIILAVVLVLFGGQKLPKLARSLGQAQSEFRRGVRAGEGDNSSDGPETETVTMTRAELDALLAEREEASRERDQQVPPTG